MSLMRGINVLFNPNRINVLCSANVLSVNSKRGLIPYKEIPRAPTHPLVGSLLHILKRKTIYFHEYVDEFHEKLGPIFIDKISGTDLVHIADADANFQIYKHEGSHPIHGVPDMWKTHSEYRDHKRGLFFMDGEEWREARTPTNSVVSNMANLAEHITHISSITKEFIDTWKNNQPKNDLRYHLYCWNAECIGSTALGRRLGFLDKLRFFDLQDPKHTDEDEFIKEACKIFPLSGKLLFKPSSLFKILRFKSWRRYCYAADIELLNGEKYVVKALLECLKYETTSERAKGSLLNKLMDQTRLKLNIHIIRRVFVEIFLASASSTSNAAVWVLYALGRYPEVAERVRQEISSVLAEELSLNTLLNLRYLRGVIKESLRMYPTTPFLTRVLVTDAELCGYHIPAGSVVMASMYTMGKNPDYFLYPDSFMPERWQSHKSKNINKKEKEVLVRNARAYSPFALGGRSCIGRNLATIDMQILVIEALKAYEWTANEVDLIFNLVGMPSEKINLILKPYQR